MAELNTNDRAVMRELLTGKRVLIVDDDNDYAEALEEIFSLQGCQVTRCCEPYCAIQSTLSHDFDLLIVDKNMPHLNGLEFVRRVRKEKPSLKIILITAYPNEESRKESLDIGIRYYLPKPFRKNDILEIASFILL